MKRTLVKGACFIYWIVIVMQGAFTGFYPYYFMNVSRLGYDCAVLWLTVLLCMAADRLMGRHISESSLIA